MTASNQKPKQTATTSQPKAATPAKRAPARNRHSAKPQPPTSLATPDKTTKRDQLAAMLLRDEGATIEQMIVALGWLPHTVRAALTGLKKLGYAIDSDKIDGLRTYRAVAP